MRGTLFLVKFPEAKKPRVIMELKLPGCRNAMRKQKALGEMRTPQTVGTTTEGQWSALARHYFVLSSFHGHRNSWAFVRSQNALN